MIFIRKNKNNECNCVVIDICRRDSFITHRAFCDALAQESARLPPSLYGSGNMGLSLSQINSTAATDILRNNTVGGAPSQFDHHQLITTPSINNPSPFRSPPPPLFLGANQEFSQQIHGLMHHSELQNNTAANSSSANNLFSFSFLSNTSNNHNNNNNTSSAMNTTSINGGGGPSSLFAGNLMSDHHHHQQQQQQHLFNTSTAAAMHNEGVVLPQMSATALLQKAAQMGATSTSNASSLLRGFATSSSNSSGAKPRGTNFIINENNHDQSHNENERHLQDLMNSLTNEGAAAMFGRFNSGRDTMTRDFLGVGSMVRGMAAGGGGGIDMGSISMDSDIKSASSSRSFAGGGLQ